MVECFKCNGKGKSRNDEWEREWDRYDKNSPSHWHTNTWMDKSGIPEYVTCPVCKGKKELNQIRPLYDLDKKKVTIEQFYDDGFSDYILLHFEDGVFAKVPKNDIEYFKK